MKRSILLLATAILLVSCGQKSGTTETSAVAVNMGLSVKWASANLGATMPEGYGDYYCWGETMIKDSYSESTYTYVEEPATLPLAVDVAHVRLGGKWRMPTEAEWEELIENCTWEWVEQNGVKGYRATSKKNGNSIFLPATDWKYVLHRYLVGSEGYYWSSNSLAHSNNYYSRALEFNSENVTMCSRGRCIGITIRPVSE